MKSPRSRIIITLFAVFFTAIFYKQMIGLNLFVYTMLLLGVLLWVYKVFDFKNRLHIAVLSGTFLTACGTLFHASSLVITMNILSLILLFGIVNNARLSMLGNTVFSAVAQFIMAVPSFFRSENPDGKSYGVMRKFWKWVGIIVIPVLVLIIFYLLYSASSSKFSSVFGFVGRYIDEILDYISCHISFSLIFLFCFGFLISAAYFSKTKPVEVFPEPESDNLIRSRKYKYYGRKTGLLTEFRIGVVMFALLNMLLAVFNAVDIWYVWFNFEWSGELLKEFVHEGTYVLIFTLMISVGLVLIFFRKNLNFYSKNKPLKLLANIWLAQNMIMTVSVLIRNLYYIHYYNLAYLRIGVLLFIVIVFFGLITVCIKINATKNFFYLFRVNMLFAYLSLVVFSLVDWDVVIAKFNFSRSEKAFVHLDFMAYLSDKALPYLDKGMDEVQHIEKSPVYQIATKRETFMPPAAYLDVIQNRKMRFVEEYPQRSFLEWNLADYKAYKKLSGR